jgi:hypothetical protein
MLEDIEVAMHDSGEGWSHILEGLKMVRSMTRVEGLKVAEDKCPSHMGQVLTQIPELASWPRKEVTIPT